jgi:hypothetical protein
MKKVRTVSMAVGASGFAKMHSPSWDVRMANRDMSSKGTPAERYSMRSWLRAARSSLAATALLKLSPSRARRQASSTFRSAETRPARMASRSMCSDTARYCGRHTSSSWAQSNPGVESDQTRRRTIVVTSRRMSIPPTDLLGATPRGRARVVK